MKKSRMLIAASLLGVVLVIFTGCDRSSEASASTTADQSQTNQRSNSTDETSNSSNDRSAAENEDKEQDGLKSDLPDANAPADSKNQDDSSKKDELPAASLKDEYLKKLNDTTKETEKMKAQDPSTYAMKDVENERWQVWDDLLNEIYGVLEKQLPQEEMEQLREEQREWIDYRDKAALDASQKYKGGTQEHLEYVAVLAGLTEKRCYELVENYMQ